MSWKALISLELAYRYVLAFKYLSYHHKKQTGGSHMIASTGDTDLYLPVDLVGLDTYKTLLLHL